MGSFLSKGVVARIAAFEIGITRRELLYDLAHGSIYGSQN
jgi:hypothetical protein